MKACILRITLDEYYDFCRCQLPANTSITMKREPFAYNAKEVRVEGDGLPDKYKIKTEHDRLPIAPYTVENQKITIL